MARFFKTENLKKKNDWIGILISYPNFWIGNQNSDLTIYGNHHVILLFLFVIFI